MRAACRPRGMSCQKIGRRYWPGRIGDAGCPENLLAHKREARAVDAAGPPHTAELCLHDDRRKGRARSYSRKLVPALRAGMPGLSSCLDGAARRAIEEAVKP